MLPSWKNRTRPRWLFGTLLVLALLAPSSGCGQRWMCRRGCRAPSWLDRLGCMRPRLSGLRHYLVPKSVPTAPPAKFHPVPTDDVFAPRGDTLPAGATLEAYPAHPRLAPPPASPEFPPLPPQPPPEVLPPTPTPVD